MTSPTLTATLARLGYRHEPTAGSKARWTSGSATLAKRWGGSLRRCGRASSAAG